MAKTINIISDTTYASKAHGVHTAFLNHAQFCREKLGLDVKINNVFARASIDHHHTLGLFYWIFKIVHPTRKHVLHAHVVFDSLVGSVKLPRPLVPLVKLYLNLCYRSADHLVAVSELVKLDLVRECRIDSGKITVIKNLVMPRQHPDLASKDARRIIGLSLDQPVILSVGQIQPRKRFDLFCDLARKMPEVNFVWVGDTLFRKSGAGTSEMDELKTNAPHNVNLPGIVGYNEIYKYYLAADLFVLLSDQENHPMAALEALDYGLPVVFRKGMVEEAEFNGAVLFVDIDEIEDKIKALLGNRKLRDDLASSGKHYLTDEIMKKAKKSYSHLYGIDK